MAPPVLAVVGPTAAGKSAVATSAAQFLGAEIVAVDAFTVYRGMDIGTAKPTFADRARVPHHLVDVLDPGQQCTVQWFQRRAREAIAAVQARGRIPLLVGGSGLYFRAVVDDLRFPPTDPEVRARLERAFADDAGAAHAAVAAADAEAADRIDPGNLRRSIRALEVMELTGGPFSAWHTDWDEYRSCYGQISILGIEVDRVELERRIAVRAQTMVDQGLLEEVRRLRRGPLSASARGAIGYAEALAFLDGRLVGGPEELVEAIRVRTRRYAVRQQRWFRGDPRIRWVAACHAAERLRSWSS